MFGLMQARVAAAESETTCEVHRALFVTVI